MDKKPIPNVLDLALAVRRGSLRLPDVPAEVRTQVRSALQSDRKLIAHARAQAATPARQRYRDAPIRMTRAS